MIDLFARRGRWNSFAPIADLIDATGDCWEWMGAKSTQGYGRTSIDGVLKQAHRVVWEALVGEIPAGLDIDHLCRNHGCVNPDHLEPVTRRENILRGFQATKIRCKNGHPFTVQNTYSRGNNNHRMCRACDRERKRSAYKQEE